MTKPIDLSKLQRDLSAAVGVRVTDSDIADALGLSKNSGAATVRRAKTEGLSGPAELALSYVAQGLTDDKGEFAVPEYVIGASAAMAESMFITRLRFPRFVGWIEGRTFPPGGRAWVKIGGTELKMTVIQWIDTCDFGALEVFEDAVENACAVIAEKIAKDR